MDSMIAMPGESETSQGKRWRERAEECRSTAEGIKDDNSRRQLSGVAESYDRMAILADQRENAQRPSRSTA
jgi:hypothetical protein